MTSDNARAAMNRFAPGTFTPDPRPAAVQQMLTAQFGLELRLLLRKVRLLGRPPRIPALLLLTDGPQVGLQAGKRLAQVVAGPQVQRSRPPLLGH